MFNFLFLEDEWWGSDLGKTYYTLLILLVLVEPSLNQEISFNKNVPCGIQTIIDDIQRSGTLFWSVDTSKPTAKKNHKDWTWKKLFLDKVAINTILY